MVDVPPRPSGADGRRRVIDLAVTRRPDMSLEELTATLRQLGLDVDEATVAADLDALGYDVDPPVDAPVAPPVERRSDGLRWSDQAPRTGDVAVVPPPAAPPAPERAGGPGRSRSILTLLLALGVIVALLGVVLFLKGDDDSSGDAAPDDASLSLDEGSGSTPGGLEPTTTVESPAVAPTGPGRDPALLADADLSFTFDTDGDALPAAGDQGEWVEALGEWSVSDGLAVPEPVDGDGAALVHFPAPGPDLRAQVALPQASPGAGLAFRVESAEDYLAWVISPTSSIVELYDVEGGEATKLLDSGTAVLDPGVSIGVNVVGDEIELLANGVVVMTTTDAGRGTGIGLVTIAPGEAPSFDDLLVLFAE